MKSIYGEAIMILQLLAIRGSGILALFLVNVAIARNFGPVILGLFQIGLALVIVGATVGRWGQDQLMLRTAAEAKATEDINYAHVQLKASLALACIFLTLGTTVALALVQAGLIKTQGSQSEAFFLIMMLAILPAGILMIVTEALRGWQKVNLSIAWQGSIPQSIFLVLVGAITLTVSKNPLWIPVAYVFAYVIAAVFAYFSWVKISRQGTRAPSHTSLIRTFKHGQYFWLYAVLTSVIAWVDVFILSYLGNAEIVGNYSAVVRTGAILGTIVQIASAGAVGRLAVLYAQSDYAQFLRVFRFYFKLFLIGSIPLLLALLAFSDQLMTIWGLEYRDAGTQLMIYGGFQTVNFALCLAGFCAPVIGLERQLIIVQVIALIAKIVLIYVGYESAGIEGALFAAGTSLFIFNLLTVQILLAKLRQNGINGKQLLIG